MRHSWCRSTQSRSTTKTRSSVRSIPIPDALVHTLLESKRDDAGDGDFVFPGRNQQRPISYWNFHDRGWRPTLKLAGLDGESITIHDLRHACASLLIAQGLSPVDVAAHLGHSQVTTTLNVYAHLFNRDVTHARIRQALTLKDSRDGSGRGFA